MTKEQYRIFIRYLKERGLFTNFFKEVGKFPERRGGITIKKAFLDNSSRYDNPIMDFIAWRKTELGDNFWANEHQTYTYFANKYKINKNKISYEFFKKIKPYPHHEDWYKI